MLQSLHIENYAIIDQLDIDFKSGFSVLTGETGAGKSIILGALALILGQRADNKAIKEGKDKCVLEAVFQIKAHNLQLFFEGNELDYADECIIRREILSSGKTRSFVNDTPISQTTLKELSVLLIDIHSQHANLLLSNSNYQLNVVDIIAKNSTQIADYQKTYKEYSSASKLLADLIETANKTKSETDYIQFQFEQLETANLKENEDIQLEEELKTLTHAEEIKKELSNCEQLLSNENSGIVIALKESLASIRRILQFHEKGSEIEERINNAYIDLKDLNNELSVLVDGIEYNPERIAYIEERLNTIFSLQQKHNVSSCNELIEIKNNFNSQLQQIANFDEEINSRSKEVDKLKEIATKQAQSISNSRNKAAKELAANLSQQLIKLGIPKVKIEITVKPKESLGINGIDEVQILFSANENSSVRPIEQIASGGEIARVMLCIKHQIASCKALPCIIFDEIDTGVSGELADKMALIMKAMGENMQVICITHLPQIAARGSHHFKVFKEKSSTNIIQLEENERITEIAHMLSGASLTDAAIENAKTLLFHQ